MTDCAETHHELFDAIPITPVGNFTCGSNPSHVRYLKIPKSFIEPEGVWQLEGIYRDLSGEFRPSYLMAAGWAAAEIALVGSGMTRERRLAFLEDGVNCWRRAQQNKLWLDQLGAEGALPQVYSYRIAMALASVPLLEGMVEGKIDNHKKRRAFEASLQVAEANAKNIRSMAQDSQQLVMRDYIGFGYECLALLAINANWSERWFAIPSMARSDNGYRHRRHAHDVLAVHQSQKGDWHAVPMEVKARFVTSSRQRYRALQIDGRDLTLPRYRRPDYALDAILAIHRGRATRREERIVQNISNRTIDMVRMYYAMNLGRVAAKKGGAVLVVG